MFKIFKTILLAIFLFSVSPALAAPQTVDVYFFYGQGCPHCAKEERLFQELQQDGWLAEHHVQLHPYEVWHNPDNGNLLAQLGEAMGWDIRGVPVTVVGDKQITGYLDDQTTGEEIKDAIIQYAAAPGRDAVKDFLEHKQVAGVSAADRNVPEKMKLPLLGEVNIKKTSLPLLTVIIGGLDGFNPCALWVLLFLISLLMGMEQRKKLFILGSTFILASAVFYFLVLTAWLNFLLFLGFVNWIRILIALAALYAGFYNLKEHWKKERTCEVVEEDKRKEIFGRVKKIVAEQKLWFALLGVAALAVSVNFFELICSAGLPAVYTQILALAGLPAWQHYAYLLLYVFVFVLNQIVILSMALWTFKMKAINPQIIRWVGLIGGSIMVVIGVLLLFKPALLMLG